MNVSSDDSAPFYVSAGNEESVFRAAFASRIPVMLKGPTGVGKTRFVEAMAHRLGCELITVACHEDLSASDLVGRYLLHGNDTVWADGPLTRAVRSGAICYLDEVVEARQDTTVVLHPLMDHRRILPLERLGVTLKAAPSFMLVVSYNPGYQSLLKDLKDSTRQRMVAIEMDFPPAALEKTIVAHETGLPEAAVARLVNLGQALRKLDTGDLREVASPRALIRAGHLIQAGLPEKHAAWAAIASPLSDDPSVGEGLREFIDAHLSEP